MSILCAAILSISNYRENARRDRLYGKVDARAGHEVSTDALSDPAELKRWGYEGYTHDQILALGHEHRAFRYLI